MKMLSAARATISLIAVLGTCLTGLDESLSATAEIRRFKSPGPLYQAPRKSLYGIGRGEGTDDTITVINGNIHSAFAANEKQIQIDDSIKTIAASFTYVNVGVWSDIPIASNMKKSSDLYPLINSTLKKIGYELAGTFPFLLKGKISSVDFHLTTKGKTLKFADKKIPGIIVGIFTRKQSADGASFESSSTMHFVSDDRKRAGVVDHLTIDASDKVSLFLPR